VQLDYARLLIDYHLDSNAHLWECVMTLTDEQFVQPCHYSLGSVRHQIMHLVNVDARWLGRLQGTELPPRLNADDFPTREAAKTKYDEFTAQLRVYADGLTEDALARTITYDIPHRGGQ
jgi:uncharacterized damage-inducible protein DinB